MNEPTISTPAAAPAAGPVYRDDREGLCQALACEHARRDEEIATIQGALAPVYAARTGRVAAGAMLVTGALVLVAGALVLGLPDDEPGALTALLLAPWPLAFIVYRLFHARAHRRFARCMREPLAPTGDLHMDLARARRLDVRQRAAGLVAALEPRSVSLPLAGMALLLPLTLHLLVWLLMNGIAILTASPGALGNAFEEFDPWIVLSMVLVGHCHVILAASAWRYGRRLARLPDRELAAAPYQAGWRAYGITALSSVIPGAFMVFLPVLLVSLTGLLVPPIFARTNARVLRERRAVDLATAS